MREKLTVTKCRKAKPGRYADGGGLYLEVKPNGRKYWIHRYRDRFATYASDASKLRERGLGRYGPHDVTLKAARVKAGECRRLLSELKDPIVEAAKELKQAQLDHARRLTFKQCADRYMEANRAGWKNPKHAAQWPATLNTYASLIMNKPVDDIDQDDVLACLEPIWETKTETATRVRQRIETVLNWATTSIRRV